MSKWQKIYLMYLGMVGCSTIMLLFIDTFKVFPPDKALLLLKGIAIGGIPVALINQFAFRTGVDKFELWARRIIVLALSMLFIGISYFIVGFVETVEMFFISVAGGFGAALVICVPIYVMLDILEKKKIRRINEELTKQNREESVPSEKSDASSENWH